MRRKTRIRATQWWITASAIALAMSFVGSAQGQREPTRHALLIGINEYTSSQVTDLRGAVNDVMMIRRILTTRFGVEDSDITVLTDERATRQGILNAIEDLVAKTREQDFVYIHFSGHGSQVRDLNGDEDDELDETILPHDARQPDIPDIIDDEFEALFAELRTENALIVFDSCHSGTVTRAVASVQPRFAPPDDRIRLYRSFATRTREVVVVEELSHVLMTGAPSGEQALDGPVDGGWFGLFSYALARSLDAIGPSATPADLHAGSLQELERIQEQLYTRAPEPQLEAPQHRLSFPLLPVDAEPDAGDSGSAAASSAAAADPVSEEPPRRAWLQIEKLDDERLRLIDGVSLNAQSGSLWGIYTGTETRFEFGNAVALGFVESLSGRDAILRVQARRSDLPSAGRAIPLAPPESGPISIRIDASPERAESLKKSIGEKLPRARFVEQGEFARFIVELEGGVWRISDAGGMRTTLSFPDAPDDELANHLARVFASSATATTLLGLHNPASDIRLFVDVATSASGGRADPSAPRPLVREFEIRVTGEARSERNSLILEVRVDRDAYLTIVDVDTEGGVNLLFPNDYQTSSYLANGFVRADALERIPDSLEERNRAGFHWDYAPPEGRDTILVFAATDLAVAETIRSLAKQAREAPEVLGDLRSALVAPAIRGIRVVASDESESIDAGAPSPDWTSASITVDVR